MTDFQIIKQAPLTFVGATNIGALFFGYCGSVAGNNEIGLVFNSTSFMLSRPIKSVEITLTSLIFRPISHITGLSLVLNGTQEMIAGKGRTIKEYTKIGAAFEKITKSDLYQKLKRFLIFFVKANLVNRILKNIVDILVIMKVSKKAIYVRTQNNAYWLKLDHF